MWYFSYCDDDFVHKTRPSFRKMVCGMIAPESQTSCWRHCRFTRIWRFGRPALGGHRTDREGLQEPWQIPHKNAAKGFLEFLHWWLFLLRITFIDYGSKAEVKFDQIRLQSTGKVGQQKRTIKEAGYIMWQGHMFLWWKIHLLLHACVASLLQVTTPAGYKIPESMQIQCLAGASCKSCCAFLWIQEHVWFCW